MTATAEIQKDTTHVGDHVHVIDEVGGHHNGLVTNAWGSHNECINVLYVGNDDAKKDQYGTQIERLSSCSHRDTTSAPGRYWYKSGSKKE